MFSTSITYLKDFQHFLSLFSFSHESGIQVDRDIRLKDVRFVHTYVNVRVYTYAFCTYINAYILRHVFTCSGLSSDDLQSPSVVVEAVAAPPALTAAAAAAANRRSD